MQLQAILALASLPGVNPKLLHHEHDAIHVRDLDEAVAHYHGLGYRIVKRYNHVCFVQRGNHRVELMEPDHAPEHTAFAVKEESDFRPIEAAVRATPDSFEIIEGKCDHLSCVTLVRHGPTDGVLQLIWRREPLFASVFGEESPTEEKPRGHELSDLPPGATVNPVC